MTPYSELESVLAVGCQQLIEKFEEIRSYPANQPVYTECQIELRSLKKNSSLYQLFLRLDAEKWYDVKQNYDRNIRSKAEAYIRKVGNEADHSGAVADKRSLQSTSTKHRNGKQPCKRIVICNRGNQCGFFACLKHEIYTANGIWHAGIRCDGVRVITIAPKQHYTNEQWVITKDAWKIFFEVVTKIQSDLGLEKQLPFKQVFINFGRWQSNPGCRHAHINMMLTQEVINLSQR